MASARQYGRSARDIASVMQRLQDEQEAVQKRTFTKWINSHLAKRDPPLVVTDLYEDIKDGVMLLALLEVLSGHKLPCEQGRKLRRIHWLANVGTALHFLEGRRSVYRGSPIKLVNINTTDVVDGRPSIVLGLIWTIILYFQIEELTSSLPPQSVQTSSTSSVDSSNSTEATSPPVKRKPRLSFQGGAKKALLKWVQKTATKRLGLDVRDFGPSWRSGVAFHAVIFALRPQLVDMERVWNQPNRANLEEAFSLAERELGIPRLLDPEDVDVDKPDEKSIMTYVAQFLKHHPDSAETESVRREEEREQRNVLRELKVWADQMDRDCAEAQTEAGDLSQQYQVFKHFREQYEMRRRQVESCIQSTQKDGMLTSDQALVKQAWERLSARLLEWHLRLDGGLPDPLGSVGVWLHQAEKILQEELAPQQSHEETANAIHRTRQLHQEVLRLVETHQQTFQRFHRDRSVGSVPVPAEQLQDMAERLNYISTSSHAHLSKLEFWEWRYRMLGFLSLGESKLKSWIIKYGRRETTELLLQSYVSFVEGEHFFQKYDSIYEALKKAAVLYISADTSVEKRVKRFLRDVADQWRSLAVEVRSVRSMLEEVQGNWEKYSSYVASLQAWLEDAERALRQPENTKREFFRTLPHWMENHAGMNAAGNFLIETCDETVARDLKHQLLLLNGRWRDLFTKAKQYARVHETQTHSETELQDAVKVLRDFLETSTAKLTSPVQVSLPDFRTFVRNVQEIKHRLPAMEVRYKTAARTAQLWTRDASSGDGKQVLATMASIKGQLYKMKEKCPLVLRECHTVLPVLEELEGQISAFYQIADHAGHIIAQQHDQHKNQELLSQQQSCKRCVCAVERSYLALQRALCCTKTLYNFDASLLQNRVTELQTTAQALMQEALEWRRVAEANGNLTRRFEETRAELEKTLRVGQACLTERGDPAELFSKHSDFFSRLDQRVLNAYLKACDDLTDILPEEEQQGLQESVRRLHKQWKDIQAEAPAHLMRLRVEAERRLVMTSLQECRAELQREEKMLATAGSERMIREHRAFFRNKNPISACERRLKTMEQLCQKLPENDPVQKVLLDTRDTVSEVKGEVESAHVRLQEHPDKWSEWHCRFGELSAWISSQHRDGESLAVQREVQRAQEDALSWLTARLEVLEELSTDAEAVTQRAALDELTHTLTTLLSSLDEAMSLDGNSERGEEEEDVLQTQEHSRILNAESVTEARQLLLIHQQKLKSQQKRKGCLCEALLPGEESREDCSWAAQEKRLQATLSAWQEFELDREAVWQFVCSATPVLQREFIFSSLENLTNQLDYARELHIQTGVFIEKTESLMKKASEIQLGSENYSLLRDQAKAAQRRVQDTQDSLGKMISELGEMQARWQHFSCESEALSSWVCEREKELEAVDGNTATLEQQIHTVEAMEAGLEEKKDVLRKLEAESRALTRFITPGEAEHIKARLMQIIRYWEELTNSVKQRGAELQASLSHKVKLTEDMEEVKSVLKDLAEKLNKPVTGCTSTSGTYQAHHEHMDAWQALKLLQPRLVSLSLGMRRISNKDQLQKEVSDLQQAHIQYTNKAARKQAKLEDLLTRWQQYERGLSVLQGWLDSAEKLCKSDTPYLITDKAKLHSQLQTLQDLQSEVPSQESLLEKLETQAEFLYPTASEERVGELTELHCILEERWCSLSVSIPLRIQELQAHLSQLEQFNQVLMTLSQWSESFLRELRYRSKVTITDLTSAGTQIKDDEALLQTQSKAMEDLKKHMEGLSPSLAPLDLHRLQARQEDCLQPFSEAKSLLQNRSEALVKLETFLVTYRSTTNSLQTLQRAVGQANWDQTKDRNLNQELEQLSQELASVEVQAVSLDSSLNKAYLHLHGTDGDRTSCRGLVEDLGSELQQIQRSMGTRQSEAEALGALWSSFTRRKELLLKSLTELEDRARKPWLPEPSTQNFQQRLWMLNQLEEELDALQHSQLWLGEKGEQLAHRDPEMVGEARRDVTLVQTSWEKIKNIISEEQEQCRVLVGMCKDYQTLKYKLGSVVERAHVVTVTQSVQHNPEDIRRTLTRLEAVKSELAGAQDDLDLFICKSKSFISELRNFPEDLAEAVRVEMDTIVDQWMDTSERTETEADRLTSALELWNEINSVVNDIECWSATSVSELSDGPVNLLSSANMDDCLRQFKLEIECKKVLMETLQGKVTELQEVTKNQEADIELQAMAADLRKKIFHAEEVYEQARSILRDFSCQSQQLQDVISQMAEQLHAVESTLSELSHSSDPENVAKIKELQKTLKQVDGGLDVTGESLRVLCRAYPAQQLTALGESITELVKRSEAATQRSSRILQTLQETLLHRFKELTQDFHSWLSELRAGTEERSEEAGDVPEVAAQLQRLKVCLERVSEGEKRLTKLHEEEEKLLTHLSTSAAGGVQERLASCQLALDGFTAACRQRVRCLEESAALQDGLEVCVEELRDWLQQMEESLQKEAALCRASQPGVPDCSIQLKRAEEIHRELLARRPSLERLYQASLPLSEVNSVPAELLSSHQALLQEAWTRLRHLQEYQAFGEALRAVGDWLEEVTGRLEKLESTEGNKEEVEERLERVQDILLMKGEGEVKLNMAAGKGELVIKSSGDAGQEVIRSKLQEVEDAWAALLLRAMSCHSRLEWTVSQWGLFVESQAQLRTWLEEVEAEVKGPLEPQLGLREKRQQLDRLCLLSADVEDHQGALCYLEESAAELYKRTGDPAFKEEETAQLRAQFDDVRAAAEERVRLSEGVVFEHEKYMATVRELTDWLMSKGEELQRCSDPSGDSASVEKKLLEVRVRKRNRCVK